jgi:GTP-binding protein
VTRDRNYGKSEWKRVFCIDTGGYVRGSDVLKERLQAELAIDEADVIIFVVDVEEELPQWMMFRLLRDKAGLLVLTR